MIKKQSIKFTVLLILFLITLVILVTNVFVISVTGYHLYTGTNIKPQADSIHISTEQLSSRRGRILDSSGAIIAQDSQTYDLIVILGERYNNDQTPAYVLDKRLTADKVAPLIGMDPQEMFARMNVDDLYQVQFGDYSRRLSLSTKEAIDNLDLPGLEFYTSFDRSYPLGLFSSNLIGIARYDQDTLKSSGKMGIEQAFDDELVGTNGTRILQQTSQGYIIDDRTIQETPAINGKDIYLTLDQGIQEQLEMAIRVTKEETKAENFFGMVMEAETGKIVGMAQDPKFDPEVEGTLYSNYNFDTQFEPGSTFKAFTYAAAIDSNNYNGEELFNSDTYHIGINTNTGEFFRSYEPTEFGRIQNAGGVTFGSTPFDNGFKWSSNVATTLLLEKMGEDTWLEYMEAFKFNQVIETDRMTSSNGSIQYDYPIEKINTTFGQGITVNPTQMLQGYSAIVNEGTMVKPYFIDHIVDTSTNQITYQGQTQVVGNPISGQSADKVVDLMRQCVEDDDGFCKAYDLEESKVIGKTGTAQMVIDGKYDPDNYVISVVLGLPYDDPQILVYFGYSGTYANNYEDTKTGINSLMKALSLKYDLTQSDNPIELNELKVSEVPHLINHSIDYARQAVANTGFEVIRIGEGPQVISQLPLSNQEILSNQKLFVLTSPDNWLMPDMTDWALKDITNFWSLTGIEVTSTGSGKVIEQSIPIGAAINSQTKISVSLK